MVYAPSPFYRPMSRSASRRTSARIARDKKVLKALADKPGTHHLSFGPRRTLFRVTGGGSSETAAERRARIMGPRYARGLGSITVDPTQEAPWYADPLRNVIESVSAAIAANRIAKENERRLAAGLPPLSQSEAKSLAPAANVAVELPQEVKTLVYVGAGAIIVLTLAALSKGRR